MQIKFCLLCCSLSGWHLVLLHLHLVLLQGKTSQTSQEEDDSGCWRLSTLEVNRPSPSILLQDFLRAESRVQPTSVAALIFYYSILFTMPQQMCQVTFVTKVPDNG